MPMGSWRILRSPSHSLPWGCFFLMVVVVVVVGGARMHCLTGMVISTFGVMQDQVCSAGALSLGGQHVSVVLEELGQMIPLHSF